MKKTTQKLLSALLALVTLVSLCACGQPDAPQEDVSAKDLFALLQTQVTYDTPLADVGDSAAFMFQDMPEHSLVTLYSGSGYFADELVWITLAQTGDMEKALESVDIHLGQLTEQFRNYVPEELDKIEKAVIWSKGVHIILCVTNDYENAKNVIANAAKLLKDNVSTTLPDTTEDTIESTTEPETTQPDTTEPETTPPTVPVITSKSGTWRDFGAVCVVDNVGYEYYGFSTSAATYYASLVSKTAAALEGTSKVYDLIIPTAIGVAFPDDIIAQWKNYEDQGARIQQIFDMMSGPVIPVDCFNELKLHRDEYLYFRTDWHWNGPGAYYAYEKFCQVKGITPYTREQRKVSEFEGYLGGYYYNNCNKDSALGNTPDTVIAYHPYSENASMTYTDKDGNEYAWNIITDVSGWDAPYKYSTFAASDQPFAEFTNPDVTDGSVAIVVKESYGNVLMSYLVDHYSTIYEIDYRYWSGDLVKFAKQVGADDVIFANNIGMIRSDYLVGLMDKIIP